MSLLSRLTHWIHRKTAPATGSGATGSYGPTDAYRRQREPSNTELVRELKSTAWACAMINAGVIATHQPKLYVRTDQGQPEPRCLTRPVDVKTIRHSPYVKALPPKSGVTEVLDHPLLTLLTKVNPSHNAHDLWEITQAYIEVTGIAYWLIEIGPYGIPEYIWPLCSQYMTPKRASQSAHMVDEYIYRVEGREQHYSPEELIIFRAPDLRDPYMGGIGPQRAAWESIKLASEYTAFRQAKFNNHALPDAIISPEEVIGEDERDRLETTWNQKMRRGGAGRVLIAESAMNVQLLSQSMGDYAALADAGATKEEVAFAYGVPQPFITGSTNLANLQAAQQQHVDLCIRPRLFRRDEKLNEQLIPLYDPSGRLFVATPDPTPINNQWEARARSDLVANGIITVDEARAQLGLPPMGE